MRVSLGGLSCALAASVLAACSPASSLDGGTGPTCTPSDAGLWAGGPLPPPAVIGSGGPVIPSPRVLPFTWQGDPNSLRLGQFVTELLAAPDFAPVLTQYGVQTVQAASFTTLTGSPPTSDSQLRALLRQYAASYVADGGMASALADTVFLYVLPSDAGYTLTQGSQLLTLCVQALGYHSFLTGPGGTPLVYAVAEECQDVGAPFPDAGIDIATITINHELAEAVTDPFNVDLDPVDDAGSRAAFNQMNRLDWTLAYALSLGGDEIGDLCEFAPWFYRDPAGFMRQSLWSNEAADAGLNPCGGGPYFGAAPEPSALSNLSPTSEPLLGVSLCVGSRREIPITYFGTDPSVSFGVQVLDLVAPIGGLTPWITPTLAPSSGVAGTSGTLTLTVNAYPIASGPSGVAGVLLEGETADGGVASLSPLFILLSH